MDAIGFCTLEQGDVLKILGDGFKRGEKIIQHGQIGFHLVLLKPAFDQPRLLVQRRINQMGHVRHAAKDFRTAGRIRQIDRDDLSAFESVGDTARNPNHIPIVLLGEVLDRGVTNQTGRAGHQHLFPGHRASSWRKDKPTPVRPSIASGVFSPRLFCHVSSR